MCLNSIFYPPSKREKLNFHSQDSVLFKRTLWRSRSYVLNTQFKIRSRSAGRECSSRAERESFQQFICRFVDKKLIIVVSSSLSPSRIIISLASDISAEAFEHFSPKLGWKAFALWMCLIVCICVDVCSRFLTNFHLLLLRDWNIFQLDGSLVVFISLPRRFSLLSIDSLVIHALDGSASPLNETVRSKPSRKHLRSTGYILKILKRVERLIWGKYEGIVYYHATRWKYLHS